VTQVCTSAAECAASGRQAKRAQPPPWSARCLTRVGGGSAASKLRRARAQALYQRVQRALARHAATGATPAGRPKHGRGAGQAKHRGAGG